MFKQVQKHQKYLSSKMTSKVIYDLLFRTYEDYKFLEKFCAENRLVIKSISDFKAKNKNLRLRKQILFNARVWWSFSR